MRLFLILTASCLLTSCTLYQNRGYSFSHEDHDFIKVGLSKKKNIAQEMGEPTISNKNSWIYFGQRTKKYLFFRPKAIKRKIIFIEFDDSGIVSSLEEFNLNSQKIINFNQDKIVSYLESKNSFSGVLKNIFSNIGQISPN
jgi:outer membrane protein assembly factor BamE (lipoprotein component of BamABCDE complex)